MSLIGKVLMVAALTSVGLSANQILVLTPTPLNGPASRYFMFGATIDVPPVPTGTYTIDISTNYGATLSAPTSVIPHFFDPHELWMGDFLLQQGNSYFGVVLVAHDGYIAGDVYQTSTPFLTNADLGLGDPRVPYPVMLSPGGVKVGTGTVLASPTGCDGTTCGEIHVKETFTIDPQSAFVSWAAPVTITIESATCANGGLTQQTGGENGDTPEPSTIVLSSVAAGLMLIVQRRRKKPGAKLPAEE